MLDGLLGGFSEGITNYVQQERQRQRQREDMALAQQMDLLKQLMSDPRTTPAMYGKALEDYITLAQSNAGDRKPKKGLKGFWGESETPMSDLLTHIASGSISPDMVKTPGGQAALKGMMDAGVPANPQDAHTPLGIHAQRQGMGFGPPGAPGSIPIPGSVPMVSDGPGTGGLDGSGQGVPQGASLPPSNPSQAQGGMVGAVPPVPPPPPPGPAPAPPGTAGMARAASPLMQDAQTAPPAVPQSPPPSVTPPPSASIPAFTAADFGHVHDPAEDQALRYSLEHMDATAAARQANAEMGKKNADLTAEFNGLLRMGIPPEEAQRIVASKLRGTPSTTTVYMRDENGNMVPALVDKRNPTAPPVQISGATRPPTGAQAKDEERARQIIAENAAKGITTPFSEALSRAQIESRQMEQSTFDQKIKGMQLTDANKASLLRLHQMAISGQMTGVQAYNEAIKLLNGTKSPYTSADLSEIARGFMGAGVPPSPRVGGGTGAGGGASSVPPPPSGGPRLPDVNLGPQNIPPDAQRTVAGLNILQNLSNNLRETINGNGLSQLDDPIAAHAKDLWYTHVKKAMDDYNQQMIMLADMAKAYGVRGLTVGRMNLPMQQIIEKHLPSGDMTPKRMLQTIDELDKVIPQIRSAIISSARTRTAPLHPGDEANPDQSMPAMTRTIRNKATGETRQQTSTDGGKTWK